MIHINKLERRIINNEEFRLHPSGLWVCWTGEVYNPKTDQISFGRDYVGYRVVNFNNTTYKVHRLVAECWISNPENKPEVDHKNQWKSDNNFNNLKWATRAENLQNRHFSNKPRPVVCYTKDGVKVKEYKSASAAEKEGFNSFHISSCCKGERKFHKGLIWRYKHI